MRFFKCIVHSAKCIAEIGVAFGDNSCFIFALCTLRFALFHKESI